MARTYDICHPDGTPWSASEVDKLRISNREHVFTLVVDPYGSIIALGEEGQWCEVEDLTGHHTQDEFRVVWDG